MSLTMSDVLAQRPAPHVEAVDIDGEVIAWISESEKLHRLDRTAALIYLLCDGEASIQQTVHDLAAAYGKDPADIVDDVIACASRLQRDGLVEVTR